MGFCHQLRLLLWKNLTLKKRSPFVVVFEMLLPLVLFVILLLIRKKLPASKMSTSTNQAKALPSTGLLSIFQMFCDQEVHMDQHGLVNFSTDNNLEKLLGQLQKVASDHDFFRPGMSPREMDDLPEIYQAVIDDPAFMIDKFKNASDVSFRSVLQHRSHFEAFLNQELDLPYDEVEVLVNSTIHSSEFYHYIFGGTLDKLALSDGDLGKMAGIDALSGSNLDKFLSSLGQKSTQRKTRSANFTPFELENLFRNVSSKYSSQLPAMSFNSSKFMNIPFTVMSAFVKNLPNILSSLDFNRTNQFLVNVKAILENGETDALVVHTELQILQDLMKEKNKDLLSLFKEVLANPENMMEVDGLKLVHRILKAVETYPGSIVVQPKQIAHLLKLILLSPTVIHEVSCDPQTFVDVVVPENPVDPVNDSLVGDLQRRLCQLNKTQLKSLSRELKHEITEEKVVQLLQLQPINVTATARKISLFLDKAERFAKFQRELEEIADLISMLPAGNFTDFYNGTDIPGFANNTDQSGSTPGEDKRKRRKEGWNKIWTFMQQTVCGRKPADAATPRPSTETKTADTREADDTDTGKSTDDDEDSDDDDDDDTLDLNRAIKEKLNIIKYYLYNNPTVLYAPNGTSADKIVVKANETIAFIDLISVYAREWLNISSQLHNYLNLEKTQRNLQLMKKMQTDLKEHKSVLSFLFELHELSAFLTSDIGSPGHYDHQLSLVDRAAEGWLHMMKGINLNLFRGFATEEDMLNYFLTQAFHDNASVIAGVVFEDLPPDGSIPPHVRYKIRQNATYLPSTKQVRKPTWVPGPGNSYYPYYQFGFVWVQDMIERAIIDLQVGRDVVEPGSFIQQFPYPCYVWDQFMFMVEHVMPLCLTISWVYSVSMLVQSIVYEKEQRLKEVMKMMGLSNAVHWCAWFVTTFIQFTISVVVLTLMLKVGHVLPHSDPTVVFMVLEIYVCAIISFSFLISVLYSKAKVAAACAGIIYFLTYVPYMYIAIKEDIAGDRISGIWKTLASLFSTTAFGLGAKYFAFYEEMGVGVKWTNVHISPAEEDEFNLLMVTLMMVFDCFIYLVLVWYIEHVFPGSYGLPKPWYFPFMKSYWCGSGKHVEHCANPMAFFGCCQGNEHLSVMEEEQACAMAAGHNAESSQRFEPDPVHLPLGVCIEQLTKVYKLGKKTAVKQLSLNLYEDQITSFLGHNGAGKTTTMSMLTGMIPPTSGTALIYNYDIHTDMDVIRQSLGFCPQHNVLFDLFTVEEHLWFYSMLKGMKPEEIEGEMNRMIDDLGLPDKRKSKIDCLSGGMQRKLSVAIAFVGGSRTVILDEPTAGVDPYARRAIWDLLVKFKKGRTILLSTHHMDEADILGDRIAIISNGQLKCCGSSIFLKNMIGDGYHLTFSKKEPEITEEEPEQDGDTITSPPTQHPLGHRNRDSPCSERKVTEFIQRFVSSAFLASENPRELHYILPFEEIKKGCFEKLFNELDDAQLERLDLTSYGLMDTSLEEIFLKVTEAAGAEEEVSSSQEPKPLPGNRVNSPIDSYQSPPVYTPSVNNLLDLGTEIHNAEQGQGDMDMMSDTSPLLTNSEDLVMEDFSRPTQLPASRDGGHSYSMTNMAYTDTNRPSPEESPRILLEGRGSHMMNPKLLLANQFKAVIVKRFHYITRNWRSLFSQIILPAIFVAIAMTVALAAPSVDDFPALELSTTQYVNVTQPRGNYVPFTNERMSMRSKVNPLDAEAHDIQETLSLASGIGASCVLKSPDIKEASGAYDYESSCQWVFNPSIEITPENNRRYSKEPLNATFDINIDSYSHSKYYPHSCSCKDDGTGFVCHRTADQKCPGFRVVTLDKMQNITGQRTHDYLLYTTYDMHMHRYGALSFGLVQRYVPDNFGLNAPTVFKKLAVRNVATMWFNHKGYHSMGVYLNSLNNAILRANLPNSKGNPAAYGITLYNHPWNDTNSQLSSLDYILEGSDVLISIFIIAAMSFVPASFVVFLVYERSTKAKHLQFVTGMNPVVYWIGNLVWDMANYVIPAFMCVMILLIFQIPAYASASNLPAVIALFLMYGWSMTPVMYPASLWFKEPSTAYIALIVINLFTGITCIVSSFLLEIFSYDHDLERVHKVLKIAFMMFPNYCLGRGLMELAFNEYKNEYYFKTGDIDKMRSAMEWDLIPCHLVAMAVVGQLFFLITIFCEYGFFIRPRAAAVSQSSLSDEDNDVAIERRRVLKGNGRYDSLVLNNLTKVYKTRKLGRHLAVDRICLGVPSGECFGLLGVNGAGKTTTFKMLTGDLQPTAGEAFLNGYSVVRDIKKVQQSIGYCPQFDSLYDELTAREHLQLYCRLRGIPPGDEKQVVEWALTKLGLTKYADKLSGTYSGGNKRKLSTAIALIGHPPIIFMDEPTTGMDPHSRRFLWDLILNLIQDGRSVILTSHSMEECEALCTRLAIMVNGKFKCLGSSTHLKNRFGDGYTFTIRVKGPNYERSRREVIRFVERSIPGAELKEHHYNIVQYELKTRHVDLALLFSKLEKAEADLTIEDYSVSQNTLDNVFINFVKQQTDINQTTKSPSARQERPSLTSRLRSRASTILSQSDDAMLRVSSGDVEESLDLSDDDILLQLDSNTSGNRLTLMPL